MTSGPPCESYWRSSVIFGGRVTEIETLKEKGGWEQRLIRFAVADRFRGQTENMVEVITGRGGGDCGYSFEIGKNYLVYTFEREDGRLGTGICSRTRELSNAVEDLEYFRELSKTKPLGGVFGVVTLQTPRKQDVDWIPNKPLANVRVTVESTDGKRGETLTDENGEYRFSDLVPGDYLLRMVTPVGLFPFSTEQKLSVNAKGCRVFSHSYTLNTSVSGRVTDEKGMPISKISVGLVPVDQINERYQRDYHFQYIDEQDAGQFTFRSIPPGNYYLGFRIDRITGRDTDYPQTFYPGTQKLEEAAVIVIQAGDVKENLNFQLAPKRSRRKVTGIVVFPDGKVVTDANLVFKETLTDSDAGCTGKVDRKTGRFEYSCLEGIPYRVKAYANFANGVQKHAEFVNIAETGPALNLKLVLSEPNGNCFRCLQ